MSRFLDLFEDGFNRIGESLNRGRFLRSHMREADFDVVEFRARLSNDIGPKPARASAETYVAWIENIPLFEESIDLVLTTDTELSSMVSGTREWAQHADAFLSIARFHAVGAKGGQ